MRATNMFEIDTPYILTNKQLTNVTLGISMNGSSNNGSKFIIP